jgi:hypothetical protein
MTWHLRLNQLKDAIGEVPELVQGLVNPNPFGLYPEPLFLGPW